MSPFRRTNKMLSDGEKFTLVVQSAWGGHKYGGMPTSSRGDTGVFGTERGAGEERAKRGGVGVKVRTLGLPYERFIALRHKKGKGDRRRR